METKKIDITYKETDDNRVNNETKEDDETMEHIPVESIGEDDNAFRRRDDEIERFRIRRVDGMGQTFLVGRIHVSTYMVRLNVVLTCGALW
ncbi:hypothetical protein QVD17_21168 [Tagetes erecta]|uniref:Uncharacterized protein n=1 Tax=Tagetes erecta TaxID=13708 RepID=A0AAD8NYN4_TARER|nr:hypothetical protein QVD17_21168 [Tagetes erecta]